MYENLQNIPFSAELGCPGHFHMNIKVEPSNYLSLTHVPLEYEPNKIIFDICFSATDNIFVMMMANL